MSARYGMVVDLNRCVGCQTCTIACKHANDTLPGVQWRSVVDVEMGQFPDVSRFFLVTGCQHCADPPCVPVCPTGATFQREDGLVAMDYDQCIGCGYCAVSCPYDARTIAHEQSWYFGEQTTTQEKAVAHPERIGVAQKCSFCVERIDTAAETGQVPGIDFEVTPACAGACIAQAIRFGDFSNPQSTVSQLVAEQPSFQMHEELGTNPQIRYLYETPTLPGREAEPTAQAPPALAGKPQKFWDFRAIANFSFGGIGTGLAVASVIATLGLSLPFGQLGTLLLVAICVVVLGLFGVFLEIGRKARFLYVLRRPQSSWMTREVYALMVFVLGIVWTWWSPSMLGAAIAGVGALAFLYCQGRILQAAKGIPSWRAPLVPSLILASGLFEGTALLALLAAMFGVTVNTVSAIAVGAFLLGLVSLLQWRVYVATAEERGIAAPARAVLGEVTPWLHVVGHVVPLVCLAFAGSQLGPVKELCTIAALAAIAGGVLWKATLIVGASHVQGFAMPQLPGRGSGRYSAPRREAA